MRTSLCWLLLHHGAAIPVEGACYTAWSGQCGECLLHLDITPVSLSWVTQRMACFGIWPLGFGIGCSFTLEGLSCPFFTWPTTFVLKGPDQLSLVSPSLPPAGQVALLWPPQALGSPLLVLITPVSLGIYLLFYPVCLTQGLACGSHSLNVCGGNEMNLHYCIGEKEPEDLNCVNDLRNSRIPLYQLSWEKLGLEDLVPDLSACCWHSWNWALPYHLMPIPLFASSEADITTFNVETWHWGSAWPLTCCVALSKASSSLGFGGVLHEVKWVDYIHRADIYIFWVLASAQQCSKCCTCITSFNPYNNPSISSYS